MYMHLHTCMMQHVYLCIYRSWLVRTRAQCLGALTDRLFRGGCVYAWGWWGWWGWWGVVVTGQGAPYTPTVTVNPNIEGAHKGSLGLRHHNAVKTR